MLSRIKRVYNKSFLLNELATLVFVEWLLFIVVIIMSPILFHAKQAEPQNNELILYYCIIFIQSNVTRYLLRFMREINSLRYLLIFFQLSIVSSRPNVPQNFLNEAGLFVFM